LEWAVSYPEKVQRCAVISIGARSTAEQIAFAPAQLLAIRQDPSYRAGDYYEDPAPEAGLALARRIAHITYRSAPELDARFGRNFQQDEAPVQSLSPSARGRHQVESYLDHQTAKFVRRFDANSYVAMIGTLISHDVTRGRGQLTDALSQTTAQFFIAAVDGDRLYYPSESLELAQALPGETAVHTIAAQTGHDGFLNEVGQLNERLQRDFFAQDS
jgi:homoserine O-acetyltransferase